MSKINKKLEEVLQKAIASAHQTDAPRGQYIFDELKKKIPDLRTLNTLHSEKLLGKQFSGGEGAAPSAPKGSPMEVQAQPDSQSDAHHHNHSPDQWSSSSSSSLIMGHLSPSSTDDGHRSVSPSSGHHSAHCDWSDSKDGQTNGFGSPRSMSSSSGVSSDDCLSRKGSISLPCSVASTVSSMAPKLAYINNYRLSSTAAAPTTTTVPAARVMITGTATSSPATSITVTPPVKAKVEKEPSIDDMPVLKRALQAPPLVNTNKLMDEAYRHHKKFRAARARSDMEPHSPSTTMTSLPVAKETMVPSSISPVFSNNCSTLLKTLEQPSRYMNDAQLKRTDLIHNIIMNSEAVNVPTSSWTEMRHQVTATPVSNLLTVGVPSQVTPVTSMHQSSEQSPHYYSPVAAQSAPVCPFRSGTQQSVPFAAPSSPYHQNGFVHLSQHRQAATPPLLVINRHSPQLSPQPHPQAGLLHLASAAAAAAAQQQQQQLASSVAATQAPPPQIIVQSPNAPYSHLQRCLAGPAKSVMLPTHLVACNGDDEDVQPLNLCTKSPQTVNMELE